MRPSAPISRHAASVAALTAALLAATALAACGDNPTRPTVTSPNQPKATTQREPPSLRPATESPTPLKPPPCPPASSNCARASGTILYVERIDPDGDGDAHFVLLSADGVTAPGLSVIDVRRELRPSPLPGLGERLAASGPVYPGSRGQRQIQADALRTAP